MAETEARIPTGRDDQMLPCSSSYGATVRPCVRFLFLTNMTPQDKGSLDPEPLFSHNNSLVSLRVTRLTAI